MCVMIGCIREFHQASNGRGVPFRKLLVPAVLDTSQLPEGTAPPIGSSSAAWLNSHVFRRERREWHSREKRIPIGCVEDHTRSNNCGLFQVLLKEVRRHIAMGMMRSRFVVDGILDERERGNPD